MPVPRGEVRPTSERARQAYFNIVSARLADSRFLDLFAGSGIFSFEALSRGAESALAVDASRQNIMLIEKTASTLGVKVKTVVADVTGTRASASLATPGMTFDLVYADPPYDFPHYDALLGAIETLPLAPGGIVAVEHRRRTSPFTVQPARLTEWRRAEYGEVWITFFTAPGLQ